MLTPELKSNFRHLYADIFWFGLLAGSSISFLAVFATRLGASSFQISLLTAGPAVVNLLFSLPAGSWLEGKPLIWSTFLSSFFQRLGYLVLALLPWLFLASAQVWMIILVILVMSVPGTLLAIGFNALFADSVPPEFRAHVVGRRNALLALTTTATSLTCGVLLDNIIFPLNYQLVFLLGGMGAMMSSYHLSRLRLPNELPRRIRSALRDLARPGMMHFLGAIRQPLGLRFLTRSSEKPLLRMDLLRGSFGAFMGAYLLFYTFQYVSIPIYPVFMVRELEMTDGQISLATALFFAAMMLASMGLSRLSGWVGHKGTLVIGALLFGSYPLLIGLAQDAFLVWLASIGGGIAWGIAVGGILNRLMERVPENDRPAGMAFHNIALNLGILLGSLLGPLLGEVIDLRTLLLANAAMRALAGIVFIFWG